MNTATATKDQTMTKAYPELKGTDRVRESCGKCSGTGYIRHYGHVLNGVCFDCNGAGSYSVLVSSVRARETRQRKAAAEAERKAAEYAAQKAQRDAEEAAAKAAEAARREAERLAAEPVPTGRLVITGEVLTVKEQADNFSYYERYILKVLVRDDRGFKVWGTLPAAIGGAARGDRVTFTATVEPSRDDDRFGFFKRPSKAAIL